MMDGEVFVPAIGAVMAGAGGLLAALRQALAPRPAPAAPAPAPTATAPAPAPPSPVTPAPTAPAPALPAPAPAPPTPALPAPVPAPPSPVTGATSLPNSATGTPKVNDPATLMEASRAFLLARQAEAAINRELAELDYAYALSAAHGLSAAASLPSGRSRSPAPPRTPPFPPPQIPLFSHAAPPAPTSPAPAPVPHEAPPAPPAHAPPPSLTQAPPTPAPPSPPRQPTREASPASSTQKPYVSALLGTSSSASSSSRPPALESKHMLNPAQFPPSPKELRAWLREAEPLAARWGLHHPSYTLGALMAPNILRSFAKAMYRKNFTDLDPTSQAAHSLWLKLLREGLESTMDPHMLTLSLPPGSPGALFKQKWRFAVGDPSMYWNRCTAFATAVSPVTEYLELHKSSSLDTANICGAFYAAAADGAAQEIIAVILSNIGGLAMAKGLNAWEFLFEKLDDLWKNPDPETQRTMQGIFQTTISKSPPASGAGGDDDSWQPANPRAAKLSATGSAAPASPPAASEASIWQNAYYKFGKATGSYLSSPFQAHIKTHGLPTYKKDQATGKSTSIHCEHCKEMVNHLPNWCHRRAASPLAPFLDPKM